MSEDPPFPTDGDPAGKGPDLPPVAYQSVATPSTLKKVPMTDPNSGLRPAGKGGEVRTFPPGVQGKTVNIAFAYGPDVFRKASKSQSRKSNSPQKSRGSASPTAKKKKKPDHRS